jgi:hypothetical protein
MSDPVHFKLTLDVTAKSQDVLTQFCSDHLRSIGWHVAPAHSKWESVKGFMTRLGIERHASVHRDIKLWKSRGFTVEINKSQTGYLREILSNADFDEFCLRHKK